ncbi:MAG: Asp-tRNA(Asn)/Glu-tRNA(Gln) amidotransferase subunit GatB [Acidobacteriota bacterium]
MNYEPVIGLEVHVQLRVRTKLFCGCPAQFGQSANTCVCPVCLGLPGALPVLNGAAVEAAVKLGVAVGCEIHPVSFFARKNYFYPDLPKGYQISQYEHPFATGGGVEIDVNGHARTIRLTRIHLEEDAGKSVHEGYPDSDRFTYLDFNRSGVPLCEIVSRPHLRTAAEAHAFLVRLRSVVTYLGICDGNMEEGSLRCDANVSLRRPGAPDLGTRTEIKNLNSFRHVQRALEYEMIRQARILDAGETVSQETRLYDASTGVTAPMRSKEESLDYRYFPEPDLPPLTISEDQVRRLRGELPEMPAARKKRFRTEMNLDEPAAEFLTRDRKLADFFEEAATRSGHPRQAASWVMGDLLRWLRERKVPLEHSAVSAGHLASLIRCVDQGTISGKMAKEVFAVMAAQGCPPEEVIRKRGLALITDEARLRQVVQAVLAEHPSQVDQYRRGKEAVFGYLMGQIMKATRGQADPGRANRLLRDILGHR